MKILHELMHKHEFMLIHRSIKENKMNTHTRRNNTDTDLGKCICVSFPYHELDLLEDLDKLARQSYQSKSQYLRQLVRKDKYNNQQSAIQLSR
jgi:hypothetical protein